jgi:hypothetical protein
MSREPSRLFLKCGQHVLILLAFFFGLAGTPCAGAESEQEILLRFQPSGFSLPVFIDLGRSEVRFKTEPDFGGKGIVRGSIPAGATHSDFIGFAWDQTNAELYVDANQNLDLTDDPGQPFTASQISGIEQSFRDIHVVLHHGDNRVPYRFNLRFMGTWYAAANITSGWAGDATIGGARFRIDAADDFDGEWGAGDRFSMKPLTSIAIAEPSRPVDDPFLYFNTRDDVGIPTHAVVDGSTYDVYGDFSETAEGIAVRVAFSVTEAPTGQVQLEGQHIQELLLKRHDGTSILYVSGNPMQIPVGSYTAHAITLDGGWISNEPVPSIRVQVRPGEARPLRVGGPLKHSVECMPSGSSILLTYTLRGVGGESYEKPGSYAEPPAFTIYRGSTRVASGNFEYG